MSWLQHKRINIFKNWDFLNLDSDYIAKVIEEGLFCNRLCSGCKNVIFVDVKKLFKLDFIRKIYDGIKNIK